MCWWHGARYVHIANLKHCSPALHGYIHQAHDKCASQFPPFCFRIFLLQYRTGFCQNYVGHQAHMRLAISHFCFPIFLLQYYRTGFCQNYTLPITRGGGSPFIIIFEFIRIMLLKFGRDTPTFYLIVLVLLQFIYLKLAVHCRFLCLYTTWTHLKTIIILYGPKFSCYSTLHSLTCGSYLSPIISFLSFNKPPHLPNKTSSAPTCHRHSPHPTVPHLLHCSAGYAACQRRA